MASDLSTLQHPRFARFYARISGLSERDVARYRARTLADLSGRVVEIGAGNGLNFRHYPPEVTEVVAVEPDEHLFALAERAAAEAPVPVRVVAGQAGDLPLDDGSCRAAVFSLVLCSIAEPERALAEARRALAPGGRLRFFEHVRSQRQSIATMQDLLAPATSRMLGGCRFNRDTTATIRAAGFGVDEVERVKVGPVSHIVGGAHPE